MDTMGYLRKIGQFGKNPDGSYTRRIFSPEWERVADLVRSEMKALSMKTDRDAAGNEHGVLLGSVPGLPAIILGSHLDTVPSGGLYDGAMGVAAALAALSRAQKEGVIFRHPMEIYAFNGEEFNPLGALFGSRVLTGWFDSEAPHMKDALHSFGKTGEEMAAARRDFAGVKCYLEAHIEQGPELAARKLPVGIVTGIAGVFRYRVICHGMANHSGTTLMKRRHDAMVGMAKLIVYGDLRCRELDDHLVFTAGTIKCLPNSANVVPNRVEATFEMRHLDRTLTDALIADIKTYAETISDVTFSFETREEKPGTYCDKGLQEVFQNAADRLHLPYFVMPSGASHDAHALARRVPVGMIFVPSRDGISHNGKEWTDAKDVRAAGNLLYEALRILDKED